MVHWSGLSTGLVKADWFIIKLHQMRHYSDYIREKGSLPQYSMDHIEACHHIWKTLWCSSNKGHDAERQCVLWEWRQISFLQWNEELRWEAQVEQEMKVLGKDDDGSEGENDNDLDDDNHDNDNSDENTGRSGRTNNQTVSYDILHE